ncbi:polysaccharide biosynthesis/export family protein [Rhodovulum sp. DZ06]|uniref:polysaccharide biosynthesis/export family protein n=1 Tax=Rhodovulum sp. DZ06 TaxID=3425126 RepID=UPI003D333B71
MKNLAFLALAAAIAAPAAAQDGYYSIKPGDVLNVTVLEDPNLSSQVLVRPDGRISLPIAGSVMAEGRSPERLEAVLRSRFASGFELTPTVTVALASTRPESPQEQMDEVETHTYYVFGQVGRPGPITVEAEKSLSILKLMAVVGGAAPFADADRIQVRRTAEDGTTEIMLFDYTALEDGLPVEDIELQDGDVVFVPERSLF